MNLCSIPPLTVQSELKKKMYPDILLNITKQIIKHLNHIACTILLINCHLSKTYSDSCGLDRYSRYKFHHIGSILSTYFI